VQVTDLSAIDDMIDDIIIFNRMNVVLAVGKSAVNRLCCRASYYGWAYQVSYEV
jgi:hypothetical protein